MSLTLIWQIYWKFISVFKHCTTCTTDFSQRPKTCKNQHSYHKVHKTCLNPKFQHKYFKLTAKSWITQFKILTCNWQLAFVKHQGYSLHNIWTSRQNILWCVESSTDNHHPEFGKMGNLILYFHWILEQLETLDTPMRF